MRRIHFSAVLLVVFPLLSRASSYVVPTTNLAAQTANNTSAANSFRNQSNGNLGANNISKVDIHTLLYSGASTKVFAHLLLWFGSPGHMNIGYSSTDPNQVHNQITDMISRGIDGVVIDWYGPNNSIDQATQAVMNEAEKHPGFTFAIMIDAGAMAQGSCGGCSPQQTLTSLLQYVERTYFVSTAYFTIDGQPVVTNFNLDDLYSIDWNALDSAVSIHPRFLFQDSEGFTHTLSDGSYSWVMPQIPNYGMSYLSGFYDAGMAFPNLETVGVAYKGFNDSLASWSTGRRMNQQCGETWLQTFSEANSLYNAGRQLPYLQLVTWNDYEEATEIESGIDNCFSLTPSLSANALQWNINGNENTVDHYNAYISTDGLNLMTLTQTEPGNRSVNLCSFPIPAGTYQLFVQAVGKPTLVNHISGPLTYSPTCATTAAASGSVPNVSLTATPNSVTITQGKPAQVTVTAAYQGGATAATLSLSCDYLPANLYCSFSPATLSPSSGTATSTLTIQNGTSTARSSLPFRELPAHLGYIVSFGMPGLAFMVNLRHSQRTLSALMAFGLLTGTMLTTSCGGESKPSPSTTSTPGIYTVSVLGNAGSTQTSANVVVTLQ